MVKALWSRAPTLAWARASAWRWQLPVGDATQGICHLHPRAHPLTEAIQWGNHPVGVHEGAATAHNLGNHRVFPDHQDALEVLLAQGQNRIVFEQHGSLVRGLAD